LLRFEMLTDRRGDFFHGFAERLRSATGACARWL
jgi:hypothetical protein